MRKRTRSQEYGEQVLMASRRTFVCCGDPRERTQSGCLAVGVGWTSTFGYCGPPCSLLSFSLCAPSFSFSSPTTAHSSSPVRLQLPSSNCPRIRRIVVCIRGKGALWGWSSFCVRVPSNYERNCRWGYIHTFSVYPRLCCWSLILSCCKNDLLISQGPESVLTNGITRAGHRVGAERRRDHQATSSVEFSLLSDRPDT